MTWFVSHDVPDAGFQNVEAIPEHCQRGIITQVQDCPSFRGMVDIESSWNIHIFRLIIIY